MAKRRRARGSPPVTEVDAAIQKARRVGLISYDDLPIPWRINDYIQTGYRFTDSEWDCVKSIFTLSNESFNIWSHLIGFLLVLGVAHGATDWPATLGNSSSQQHTSTAADNAMRSVLIAASLCCLFCSTMWHTMNCIAKQSVMEKFDTADMMSVTALVTATAVMIEYTGFYCEALWRTVYISITGSLGLAALASMTLPTLRHPSMSWLRVSCFLGIGFTSVIPVFQLLYYRGAAWTAQWYAPMGGVWPPIIIGAVVYGTKAPERLSARKIRLCGIEPQCGGMLLP